MSTSKSDIEQELYSEAEVLKILGVARPTLQRWRDKGMIKWLQVGTRRRYLRVHITEFLEKFNIHGTDID